jgi:septal ring factor EnvC (AmiA/AmiB activator)
MATGRIDDGLRQAEEQIGRIQENVNRLESVTFADRSNFDADLDRQLAQLDTLINKMNNDLKSVPPADRDFYSSEIANTRASHGRLLGQVRDKRASLATNPAYQHSQLVQSNTQVSSDVVNNFDRALAIGADTSATMDHTAATLAEDDQIIDHTSQQLTEVHGEAIIAQNRLKDMACRALAHKIIVWIVVACLFALFVLSIVLKTTVMKKDDK